MSINTAQNETNDIVESLALRQCIAKVATGPEYSKNLNFDEAYEAMSEILTDACDPVQAAVFMIALRMKRETDDENKGILKAIIDVSDIQTAQVDEILDIADPYDGHTRGLPMAAFIAPVTAALGIPSVCHGLDAVGPKYGITHRKILKAAGKSVDLSLKEAIKRIETPEAGWAYIDQNVFAPKLHDLISLRTRIVKRPVLTTVEVLLGPIRGKKQTHLLTGYVHKAYPPVYAELARFVGFDSAMIVRGVEGGVIPSLQQPAKLFSYHDGGAEQEQQLDPKEFGIEQATRAVPLPKDLPAPAVKLITSNQEFDVDAAAGRIAEIGVDALKGATGPARDALIYSASICLKHLGKADDHNAAATMVKEVLDSGKALACFNAG